MKRLLGLLLVMGMVGCGGPVAELRSLEAKVTKYDQGKVIKVDLSKTQVTDAGLVHLKELANLQYLFLGEAKITDSGIVELQKTLPNCEILMIGDSCLAITPAPFQNLRDFATALC